MCLNHALLFPIVIVSMCRSAPAIKTRFLYPLTEYVLDVPWLCYSSPIGFQVVKYRFWLRLSTHLWHSRQCWEKGNMEVASVARFLQQDFQLPDELVHRHKSKPSRCPPHFEHIHLEIPETDLCLCLLCELCLKCRRNGKNDADVASFLSWHLAICSISSQGSALTPRRPDIKTAFVNKHDLPLDRFSQKPRCILTSALDNARSVSFCRASANKFECV